MPKAQRDGTVVVAAEQEKAEADWDRMLEELETIEDGHDDSAGGWRSQA